MRFGPGAEIPTPPPLSQALSGGQITCDGQNSSEHDDYQDLERSVSFKGKM